MSDIVELGDSYWFDRGQEVTVREIVDHMRLVNAADLGHAIIVDPDGRVLDGMHRVAKALLLGHQTIEAKRLLELPDPHYTDVDADELPYDE